MIAYWYQHVHIYFCIVMARPYRWKEHDYFLAIHVSIQAQRPTQFESCRITAVVTALNKRVCSRNTSTLTSKQCMPSYWPWRPRFLRPRTLLRTWKLWKSQGVSPGVPIGVWLLARFSVSCFDVTARCRAHILQTNHKTPKDLAMQAVLSLNYKCWYMFDATNFLNC